MTEKKEDDVATNQQGKSREAERDDRINKILNIALGLSVALFLFVLCYNCGRMVPV